MLVRITDDNDSSITSRVVNSTDPVEAAQLVIKLENQEIQLEPDEFSINDVRVVRLEGATITILRYNERFHRYYVVGALGNLRDLCQRISVNGLQD